MKGAMHTALWVIQGIAAFMFFATGTLKVVVPRVKLMEKMHWAKTWSDTNVKLLGSQRCSARWG